MSRLTVIIGGCIFVAAAIIALVSDHNWQGSLFLFAIGIGFLIFFFKGEG
jgi:hypothetical protein